MKNLLEAIIQQSSLEKKSLKTKLNTDYEKIYSMLATIEARRMGFNMRNYFIDDEKNELS